VGIWQNLPHKEDDFSTGCLKIIISVQRHNNTINNNDKRKNYSAKKPEFTRAFFYPFSMEGSRRFTRAKGFVGFSKEFLYLIHPGFISLK